MSKHNYSQYSNKNNKPRSFEQSQTAVNNEPTVEPKVVTETVGIGSNGNRTGNR